MKKKLLKLNFRFDGVLDFAILAFSQIINFFTLNIKSTFQLKFISAINIILVELAY